MAEEIGTLFLGKKKKRGQKKDMEERFKNDFDNTSSEEVQTCLEKDQTPEQENPDAGMDLTQIDLTFSGKKKPRKKKNRQSHSDAIFLDNHANCQAICSETVLETNSEENSHETLSYKAQEEVNGDLYTYKEVLFLWWILHDIF